MRAVTAKLTAWIVGVPGLLLAVLLATYVGQGNYMPVFAAAVLAVLCIVYFSFGAKLWILIPIGLALPFKANFLPLDFSYSELITGLALALFVMQFIILERRKIALGPKSTWVPLFGVVAILAVHLIAQGGGFQSLGADGQGGRKYLPCFVGLVAYILILTTPGKDLKLLNKLPLLYFAATVVGVIPSVITTIFPAATPIFFRLFGSANTSAYAATQGVVGDLELTRFADASAVGIALFLCLASYYPCQNWWKPKNWWILGCVLLSVVLVMFSGYRSNLFKLLIVGVVLSFLRMGGLRSIFLAVAVAGLTLAIAFGNGSLYKLPYTVQRVLSPIPTGTWDARVVADLEMSNNFRSEISEIYRERYMKAMLFGSGFAYDRNEFIRTLQLHLAEPRTTESFVVAKDFHIGWISMYDGVGIIGVILCILLILSLWAKLAALIRSSLADAPITIWLTCMLLMIPISYFTVFGSLPTLLNELGIFSALLICTLQFARPRHSHDPAVLDEDNVRSLAADPALK